MGPIWSRVMRAGLYVVLATLPIIGAYDYGSSEGVQHSLWEPLVLSVILAAIIAVIGEATLFLVRKWRH